ncbi:MAG: hypothetical protein VYE73_12160 [Acidobacteriota bacterium]|nr:hypothetical protein [Acidobacteriota bacterium]
MRDGISFARRQVPAVALVTEDFWPQGNFVAKAFGMPDVPRVMLPHPVSGSGDAAMTTVAAEIAPAILAVLGGALKGEVPLGTPIPALAESPA